MEKNESHVERAIGDGGSEYNKIAEAVRGDMFIVNENAPTNKMVTIGVLFAWRGVRYE